MIRPLRIRHRRIFVLLGVLLPIALGLGVAARRPVPEAGALPAVLRPATLQFSSVAWTRQDLFTNVPIQVRLVREQRDTGRFGIGCSTAPSFVKPDLLLYWSNSTAPYDRLPSDALFLGAFNSSPLALPEGALTGRGVLVLFSLADQEVVAVSRPVRFNDLTK